MLPINVNPPIIRPTLVGLGGVQGALRATLVGSKAKALAYGVALVCFFHSVPARDATVRNHRTSSPMVSALAQPPGPQDTSAKRA